MTDTQLFVLPPPPRSTGNAQQDLALIVDWEFQLYNAVTAYVQSQTAAPPFNPGTLPDPASTSLAAAQTTANQAYTLANTAENTAVTAQATATAAGLTASGAVSSAAAAALAAASAQATANTALAEANIIAGWFGGQLVISDAATDAVHTFSSSEADTNYRVFVTPVALSGGAAPGANRVLAVVKTTTDITLNIETAPGVGESATFDFLVVRF